MQGAIVGTFVIGVLLFIFFVPTSWIIYRNTNFRMPLKLTFSLSVVPLFIFLMTKNYFFIADHFPRIIDLYSSIPDAQKSRQGGLIITFILTCPLSFFGCYIWYKILYLLDKRIYGKHLPETIKQNNEETTNKIKFFETKWMGYFIVSLLITLFVGFEFLNFLERNGRPISTLGLVVVLATLPVLSIVIFIKKRTDLIKRMYNQADAPGDKAPR